MPFQVSGFGLSKKKYPVLNFQSAKILTDNILVNYFVCNLNNRFQHIFQ